MARLDVRRLKAKGRVTLVVEIQSDYMRELPTVVVAPLIKIKELKAYDLINPVIEIRGQAMAIRLEQMAGVPVGNLGDTVASARHAETAVSAALQRLLYYV